MKKVGFTIGKFAPLHKGHQYLIETALKEMDEMYVVVYETDKIDVPVEERAKWIKKLYPNVNLIYAYNPPLQYGLDEESVDIQINYLSNKIGKIPVTHFYSSEEYGRFVAEKMGVIDRRVDEKREVIPVSATLVRENLNGYKKFVNEIVYKDIK